VARARILLVQQMSTEVLSLLEPLQVNADSSLHRNQCGVQDEHCHPMKVE
jgi:hypothetical protein